MRVVLLDSIRSMQNVWAIFRNCDWAWFDKIIMTGFTPFPPRNDIWKTAIWAEKWIDWEYFKDPVLAIEDLKKKWFKIISVELTQDAVDYRKLPDFWDEKICIVMWNEILWVNEKILEISDLTAIIPMKWKKSSLNVSVAAWIVMYQLV